MLTLFWLLAAGFALCLVLTPLARSAALRCGLVDHPDGRRKMHGRPVPLAGGLAVLASACLALGLGLFAAEPLQDWLASHSSSSVLGLLVGALAICALGVVDDFGRLRGRHKLIGQVAVAALVVAFGIQIRHVKVFGADLDLGAFSVPVTLLWLLGAINSLNLLDGMDGLLGSVGVIVTAAMAAMAVLGGQWAVACVAVTMTGALLGFLCYNFPPASVFLGDAGSMLVGLVVGVLGIQCSIKGPATVALIAPATVLTIPFFDTLAAILRRKLTGRSIYTTDRGHLHHCLQRRGLSERHVLLVVSFLCVLTSVGALASLALHNEVVALVGTLAVVAVLLVTRLFGRAEAELLAKRLRGLAGSFLRVPGDGNSRQLEVHIQGSADWKALLDTVITSAKELDLSSVRLDVNAPSLHEEYHAEWERLGLQADSLQLWRAEIPLVVQGRAVGRLRVAGPHEAVGFVEKIARITQIMEEFQAGFADGTALRPVPEGVTAVRRLPPAGPHGPSDAFKVPLVPFGG
jgi:UDP-GlcNAc:undecaprenyl-phosphate GlcNAc-1-phosphate transferase